ncbi:disease resistance protein Pikm1-TS-like [Phragmites australis]|uniref:disease resistance protein Pikm1-TS-like n=1 Tax=Phragmites australis TaxID=29695 RepID=UPI002D7928F8|nr:disease resistance protein Pikm1-TS-like [Phragmites australis]
MKQKIVIKVQMTSDKCRSKAMALVAATGGVDSVALAGDGRDQVVVVGDGVDSIKLTSALRKKVGPARLVQVGEDKKKEDDKKPAVVVTVPEYQWYYNYPPPPVGVVYEHGYGYHTRPDTCSIL